MLLAEIVDEDVRSCETVSISISDDDQLVEALLGRSVDLFVCGGISRETEAILRQNGLAVVQNVAGESDEILDVLRRGQLAPGYGLRRDGEVAPLAIADVAAPRKGTVDCIACSGRECMESGICLHAGGGWSRAGMSSEERHRFEIGRDVSSEEDPKLCRIAELVHFGLGMGYRHIGLAFCWEMFDEAAALARVIWRFFSVTSVCCRIGATRNGKGVDAPCDPVAQAEVLARAGTDLNVAVGLCLGSDLVFQERSRAPVTTLFVKDRSLAHNPVGAIYTRYHLEMLEAGGRPARRTPRRVP